MDGFDSQICGAMLAKAFLKSMQPSEDVIHIKKCPYCFDAWLYHYADADVEIYHVTCKCKRMRDVQKHKFKTKEAAIRFWDECVEDELYDLGIKDMIKNEDGV